MNQFAPEGPARATGQDAGGRGAERKMGQPSVLVFDSGLGGLTVYRELAKARPDAEFVYFADDAFFPYGFHGETELVARVTAVMGKLISVHHPDLVVVACNTASTLVLPRLRSAYAVPFIGTVPAIKPACASSISRLVSVLGTQATVDREYTKSLIRDFANGCEVTLVGATRLAAFAEDELHGAPVEDRSIASEMGPCFVERDGRRTDTVVLACTHYPLLLDRLERSAPWPVNFIDPAPAIARRLIELIGPPKETSPPSARIHFSSGRAISPSLAAALAKFGISP
jgi:glutamate racemase